MAGLVLKYLGFIRIILKRELSAQLQAYTSQEFDGQTEGSVMQLKLKALIMDVIHMVEVC